MDVIEDVTPLFDVTVSLRMDHPIKSIACVPQGLSLPVTVEGGRATFSVPRIDGHQMVEIVLL